jgi:hypothetical protein
MAALMRRTAAILVLAMSVLLAGCGGAAHTAATSTASSSAATTTPAPGAGSRPGGAPPARSGEAAKARAFAIAVNLKASDLPGFHPSSDQRHQSAAEKRLEPELTKCVGGSGARAEATEVSSKSFERGRSIVTQSVSSQVTVARTAALAARELAAIHSGHLQSCLASYFKALLASEDLHGAKVGPVSTKQGSPPASGAQGSFGLRFIQTVTLHGVRIPFYVDILGFVKGRAQVSLFTFGVLRPFPAALEEQLFSVLLERAKEHSSKLE